MNNKFIMNANAAGLVRLHNLPRYTGVGGILHFLWSAIDFEPDEALICAFSAKNAVVRFKSQYLADEAVRFCSGRSIYGHIVTVHPSNVEELERVKGESADCPPQLKKQIADKRDGPTDAAKGNDCTSAFPSFPGLLIDSDDDDFDMMELKLPEYFLRGQPPDQVDFARSAGSADSRPGTSSSTCTDDMEEVYGTTMDGGGAGRCASSVNNTTNSSAMSISVLAEESENGSDSGSMDSVQQQQQQSMQRQRVLSTTAQMQQQPMLKRKLSTSSAALHNGGGGTMPPLYDAAAANWKKPRNDAPSSTAWDGRAAVSPPLLQYAAVPQYASLPFRAQQPLAAAASVHPAPPWHINAQRPPFHPLPPQPFAGAQCAPSVSLTAVIVMPVAMTPVISARHILLQWQLPPARGGTAAASTEVDTQTLTIVCQQHQLQKDRQQRVVHQVAQLGRRTEHVFEVCAGRTYAVTLEGFAVSGAKVTHGNGQYRAIFSRTEMQALYSKAKKYCGDQMYPFDVLHRSKPKAYWDNIYDSPGGMRIMRPYTKDENGHPGCPINGSIDGLFFSTLLQGNQLPKESPFGDVQMVVSARKLLDFDTCNMYFVDFYCNQARADDPTQSSVLHYVTVVVCKHGSTADSFCKAKRMIQLDWFNNSFLKVHLMPGSTIASPQYLAVCRQFNQHRMDTMVEVYYTEPFSLFEAEDFNEMVTFGKGSSRKEGLPNNKQCTRCNIYDVRRCTHCADPFPFYPGDTIGISASLCPKCDPNSGRSHAEFA